uniref:Uncharacterized protein n=1 Tax=Arundo donax TaxID=35708 RepID=A0A0A8XTP8_ARUDO
MEWHLIQRVRIARRVSLHEFHHLVAGDHGQGLRKEKVYLL